MRSPLAIRLRRLAAAATIGIVSVVVTLLACEAALRVVGYTRRLETSINPPSWIVYDPVILRKNQPGFVSAERGFSINALGFRGDEITREKPPGMRRIVCLGDSTTFGVFKNGPMDVRATAPYPAALARRLVAAGIDDVQVINAGTLGYTSSAALGLLLTQIRTLAPDVLIVKLGNNDHSRLHGEGRLFAFDLEYAVMRALPPRLLDWEIVRLGFHGYRRWLSTRAWATTGRQVPLDLFERNLHRLLEVAESIGAHVLFLDFPYRALERGESPGETFPNFFQEATSIAELHRIHDEYQAVTARVAGETGTPYLKTVDALRAREREVFTDDDVSHPSEAGAEVIAQLVYDRLRDLGWLGAGAPHGGAS